MFLLRCRKLLAMCVDARVTVCINNMKIQSYVYNMKVRCHLHNTVN